MSLLIEKNFNVIIGSLPVENIFLGTTPVKSLYLGANLLGGVTETPREPFTTDLAPKTQFRTNGGSYAGIGNVTDVTLDYEQPLWIDVQNYVACRTYFTLDGTEPTKLSWVLSDGPFKFTSSAVLKTKTISIFGVAEVTKTLNVTVNAPPQIEPGWRYVRFIR